MVAKKIVSTNKKAFHDYTIESTIEAGVVLTGPEVKSLRAGRANLRDGYAAIAKDEVHTPTPPIFRQTLYVPGNCCSAGEK